MQGDEEENQFVVEQLTAATGQHVVMRIQLRRAISYKMV